MKPTNTRSMVEGAMLSAITVIIGLFSLYVPFVGLFAFFIWPVPITILGIRHGLRTSILATVVAGMVLSMLEGPTQGFTLVLGFGLLGIFMGWAINRGYPPVRVLIISAAASLVSQAAAFLISLYIMGVNPITLEITAMRESINMVNNMYKNMGVSPEAVKAVTENFDKMLDLIALAIPGMFIVGSLLFAFLNYQVTKIVLSRLGQRLEDFTPFWFWKLPEFTVFFFLVGVLLTLLETYWPVGILKSLGLNLQLIFQFAFLIEGFSLTAYFMGKLNASKILRVLVIFLIFTNPIVSQVLIWAGMFDILFNFRHI